jgi:hypothetical protein
VVILKWKSLLNLRTRILLLTLILNLMLPSIALTSKKFSGNFKTETIRQLWQMCSASQQKAGVPPHIYTQTCDCFIDQMRTDFDNSTVLQNMGQQDADELAVILRLSCNKYKID